MKRSNQIASVAIFLFGLVLIEESTKLSYTGQYGRPGAGFFPFWLGVIMVILSAQLFFQSRLSSGERDKPSPFSDPRRIGKPALILGSLLLCGLLLQPLGFLVSIGLLLAFLLVVVERYRWQYGLATAFVGAGAFYLVFEVWLGVPLPIGFLGI